MDEETTEIFVDAARLEYEYPFRRAEKYDNKIYVLLTVCGFVLVMFTGAVGNIGEIDIFHPFKSGWIAAYDVLLVMCMLGLVTVLVRLIKGMDGLNMRRYDAGEIIKDGLMSTPSRNLAMLITTKYENIREYNNLQLGRRYNSLNKTVKMLLVVVTLLVAITIVSRLAVQAGGIS